VQSAAATHSTCTPRCAGAATRDSSCGTEPAFAALPAVLTDAFRENLVHVSRLNRLNAVFDAALLLVDGPTLFVLLMC
jgi:hypothetical protein